MVYTNVWEGAEIRACSSSSTGGKKWVDTHWDGVELLSTDGYALTCMG